ncbi:hypothetical protein [Chryseobacterium polytrichastri]|uniref:Uncharacterized protein n=1 Tax=Chryseobacterium polytrichastri TaxID=1302687 RepID=A0A1M7HFF3_9FLAO|nr:hypothetical protein [Chryseobacterium polytrichastri]SHM26877.1 hypothetical protein SAMN05444267_104027 [Chryseobacterium polytrichastri]
MDWQYLKDNIYFSDGSLRDIYVLNISRLDWLKWIDFINENFEVRFTYCDIVGDLKSSNQIISKYIFDYWDNVSEFVVTATIMIGEIILNCYFFTEVEIENDITPKEIKSLDDHNQIIDYLKSVSKILNKEVILTAENYDLDYDRLITVVNDQVLIK